MPRIGGRVSWALAGTFLTADLVTCAACADSLKTQEQPVHDRDAQIRRWTHRDGARTARAALVGSNDRVAHLRSARTGRVYRVPLDALTPADADFVRDANSRRRRKTYWRTLSQFAMPKAIAPLLVTAGFLENGRARPALVAMQRFVNRQDQQGLRPMELVAPVLDSLNSIATGQPMIVPRNPVYIRISKPFLDRYFGRDVERLTPVRETMLGAFVQGTALTRCQTQLVLQDSDESIRGYLWLQGNNHVGAVSSKGPIRVHTRGVTHVQAWTEIRIDADGARHTYPSARTNTQTTTTGITTSLPGLRGRISLRIARRQEQESHAQAERISAARTKARIESAFERWVREEIEDLSRGIRKQVQALKHLDYSGDTAIEKVVCRSRPDRVEVVLLVASQDRSGFPEPPESSDAADIQIHLHQSLMHRVIADPDFRTTLQSAVNAILKRRPLRLAPVRSQRPPLDFDLHWSSDLNWMTLAWRIKPPQSAQTITASKR